MRKKSGLRACGHSPWVTIRLAIASAAVFVMVVGEWLPFLDYLCEFVGIDVSFCLTLVVPNFLPLATTILSLLLYRDVYLRIRPELISLTRGAEALRWLLGLLYGWVAFQAAFVILVLLSMDLLSPILPAFVGGSLSVVFFVREHGRVFVLASSFLLLFGLGELAFWLSQDNGGAVIYSLSSMVADPSYDDSSGGPVVLCGEMLSEVELVTIENSGFESLKGLQFLEEFSEDSSTFGPNVLCFCAKVSWSTPVWAVVDVSYGGSGNCSTNVVEDYLYLFGKWWFVSRRSYWTIS